MTRAQLARIDSFPYRHLRARRHERAGPVCAAGDDGARGHAAADRQAGEQRVRARASGETGIVTERDVLRAIDEGGEAGAVGTPSDTIMKAPLQTVAEDAFLYRAIGRIERLGFRHLGVDRRRGRDRRRGDDAATCCAIARPTAIMLGDEIDSAADGAGARPPPGPSCR